MTCPESVPMVETETAVWSLTERIGQAIVAASLRPTLYVETQQWVRVCQPAHYYGRPAAVGVWKVSRLYNTHPQAGNDRPRIFPPQIDCWPALIEEGLLIIPNALSLVGSWVVLDCPQNMTVV